MEAAAQGRGAAWSCPLRTLPCPGCRTDSQRTARGDTESAEGSAPRPRLAQGPLLRTGRGARLQLPGEGELRGHRDATQTHRCEQEVNSCFGNKLRTETRRRQGPGRLFSLERPSPVTFPEHVHVPFLIS